jgi:serine/threonine-protein kinase
VAAPASTSRSAERRATAEALFDRALELMKQGRFADACPLLEQSQRTDEGVGTLLYLGECYERAGRTASAWATFREAASAAEAAGHTERATQGRERAERLHAQLSHLTIEVAQPNQTLAGFSVARSGTLVPAVLWGTAAPVDPGDYEITASAPGYRSYRSAVHVGADAVYAKVSVPALEREPSAEKQPRERLQRSYPAASPVAASPPARATEAAEADPSSSTSTWGWVLSGVGLAAVGAGSYFGLRAIDRNDQALALCPMDNVCGDPAGVMLTDDARRAATFSNIAFGVGAAALAGGVALLIAGSGSGSAEDEASSRASWALEITSRPSGSGELSGASIALRRRY